MTIMMGVMRKRRRRRRRDHPHGVATRRSLMTTRAVLFSTRGHSAPSVGRRPALPRGRVRAAVSSTHVCEKRARVRVMIPLSLYWTVRPSSCVS